MPTAKQHMRILGVALGVAGLLTLGITSADAGLSQSKLVSDTPASYTPNLKTGYTIHDQAVVGDTVYSGGQFTQFTNAARTVTYNRQNFIEYNTKTGAVSTRAYNFNGPVVSVVGSSGGSAVYVGGTFTSVNGRAVHGLVKINVASGTVDTTFTWGLGAAYALDYAGGKLYVGGAFAARLLAVDPNTGANTGQIGVSVTGNLGTSGGATRVAKIAINPAGNDLVAIGNFTTVNGQSRNSAFRLSVGVTNSALKPWHPERLNFVCNAQHIAYYMRGVDWSPDGKYFVMVSTGGPHGYPGKGFCDAAGRWEVGSTGLIAEPTWINFTGGDSLYSVAISGPAVYVGGHNRWLDNPQGHDSAGPGAYEVDSIGVINPSSGKADKSWNATPMTRGHGKEDLTLYSGGLVEGSDGTLVKGRYRKGTAIFPLN